MRMTWLASRSSGEHMGPTFAEGYGGQPSPDSERRLVEAAGVELKGRGFANVLMVRDFWY
jgi:hypothetical protein